MKYCTKCGQKIEGNKKFCTKCGAKLEDGPSSIGSAKSSKKINPVALITIIAAALVVILIGKNVFSSHDKTEDKSDNKKVTQVDEKETKTEKKSSKKEDESSKERFNDPDKKKNNDKKASDVSNFKYDVTSDGVRITKYIGTDKEVTVPNKIEGTTVTEIAKEAFAKAEVDKVVLKEGITVIGDYAFSSCKLSDIELPKGVKTIGKSAFAKTENLSKIEIPSTVTLIGDGCFNNSNINSITIKEGKEAAVIGKGAFLMCSNLKTDVVIPGNYLVIEEEAFREAAINSFKWEKASVDGRIRLGEYAFYESPVTDVCIEMKVPEVETNCFHSCQELLNVKLPESVEIIGDSAFGSCINLETINLPEGLVSIGSSSFWGCEYLTDIVIPSTMESIGENAFANCTQLKNVTIKEGKKAASISEGAFTACPLTEIVIPENYTSVYLPNEKTLTLIKWEGDKKSNYEHVLLGEIKGESRECDLELYLPYGVEYKEDTERGYYGHVDDYLWGAEPAYGFKATIHIDRDNPLVADESYYDHPEDFVFEFYD